MSRQFTPGPCRLPLMGSALALALAVADVQALGLGGLRVQSALNQPFVGEIALLDVKPDELDAIKVQIASAEEFTRAGSERYQYLSGLRFSPQISPRGETVIRVSSREPIREPYMDLLVEVTWPKGRLVKGYTVLLDPPVTDGRRTSRIDQPVVQSRGGAIPAQGSSGASAATPASRQARTAAPPPPVQPAPVPAALAASAGGFPKHIGPVPRGAGLWRLATRNAPAGATAAQTAMALYRNNQDAFVRGDINRLRAGKTLVIPNAAELFALGPEAAQREFAAALRGETVRRSPIADTTAPGPEGEPQLKIAGAAAPEPRPGVLGGPPMERPEAVEQELLLVREASESTRQETTELRGRIRELEAQLGEIQQLLQLRNAELARIQGAPALAAAQIGQGQTGPAPEAPREPAVAPSPSEPEAAAGSVSERPFEEGQAAAGAAATPEGEGPEGVEPGALPGPVESVALPLPEAGPQQAEVTGSAAAGRETVPEEGVPAEAAGPGAKTPEAAAAQPEQAQVETQPAAPKAPRTAAGLPQPWADLLVPLAGAAGVTALGLGALAWVRARRRRASEDSELEAEDRDLATEATAQASAGGATTPAGLAAAAAAPPSVFSALGASHPDSDEADVLSEADIYIAYGRYREAEELLREEILRTPHRVELKYKLAESYHGAKNYPALDGLMKEMQGAGEDRLHPERWQRLVDMAKAIEGLERADAGVRPASTRAAPTPLGLVDRGGPRSGEAFSLDISDAKGALGALGLAGDLGDGPDSTADPSQRDVPVLRSSRPAPRGRDDLDLPSLDLDVLPESSDLKAQGGRTGPEAPLELEEGEPFGGGSDLELTIDDLRAASDLDLESFVDSTRTVSNLVEEPPSPPGAGAADASASHPPKLRAVTTEGGGLSDERLLGGSLYGLEEGSSDLLSSQWQMDSGLWDETATKLDLARAYVEMGDQDSARGILEEVVNEGNEEQRGETNQMLRALG
jgi:pilus assembly protein FimV